MAMPDLAGACWMHRWPWWQWGKPEQTAAELLSAVHVSPGEVRDRPAIRKIVTDLRSQYPHVAGVRELIAATGVSALRT